MPLKPDLPFPKSAGDPLRSKDWNDLVTETQRLDNAKVDRTGDTISGALTVSGGLVFEGSVAHINRDGALYRNTDGQCYLTVDDNLFVRKSGSSTRAFHLDASSLGSLTVSPDQDIRTQDVLNLLKFGSQGDYQLLHKQTGHFSRHTLALHCDQADAVGFYSTGWTPLLEVAGGSGDLYVKGAVNVPGGLIFEGTIAHVDRDGALYRNTDGQCYLTVDDHMYIRKSGAAGQPVHFDVSGVGQLGLAGASPLRGSDVLNIMKFGNTGDYQMLHKASGIWGRNTLALHCDQADAFGIYSTGWNPLLEVAGGTGDLFVRGKISCPRFKVTSVVVTKPGGLPVSGTFSSSGGTLVILASGSGWHAAGAGTIGMMVRIDNIVMGTARAFTNEAGSHKAFPPIYPVVTSIGAGNHTADLIPLDVGTATDVNDYFSITIIEFPF